ncbi:MAG TPA: crotonase/enoyl-CoA hydratase family protein [Solirubrobacteraceae bacterium]|nr:crotonase/enoyl-CoA hydratase family protein [Solirubrobacteraceae bacterium]
MTDDTLLVERRGPVLLLTINRPHVRNALDAAVSHAIAHALDELDARDELRVAVLTGAGGTFSAGQDLKAFGRGELAVVEGRGLAGFGLAPPRKPLIAGVEGYAVGGGFEVALACDLIVAARDATFGIPEVKRGLLASGGALIRLPKRMPYHLAMELALTGAPIGAERAAALGVVSRVTEPGEALAAALTLAGEIAANGPLAVEGTKEVLSLAAQLQEEDAWRRQGPINERVAGSDEAAEGARAFVEKREPAWRDARA